MTTNSNADKPVMRLSDLQNRDDVGLVCRKCGCRDLRVYYTRERPGVIARVRICRHCQTRIATSETVI